MAARSEKVKMLRFLRAAVPDSEKYPVLKGECGPSADAQHENWLFCRNDKLGTAHLGT